MDFATPDSMKPILDRARGFVQDEVIPRELAVLRAGFRAAEPELQGLRTKVKTLGMWAPQAPRELGGMGLSLLEHALLSESLGRSPLGHYVFGCQAPDAGNMEILHLHGSSEQRERYLVPLVAGKIRSCFAMTEPDRAGSNPTLLACRAEKDGGDYVLRGRKWFASAADGAAFAIVMAVTDPLARPHGRATQIIVPAETVGFRLVRNIPLMGQPGEGFLSHGEIELDGCRVPQTNRLGAEGSGFAIAQERLGPGRIHHCMRFIGIAERAFDLMCGRARTRLVDEGQSLADKDIVKTWIAESRARIDAARLLVLRTAWRIDREGQAATRTDVHLIKFHVADVMLEVVDRAIQVHGALGLTDDSVLSWFYAHERGARIYDGPDEVHKLAAARNILGGPRRGR